MTNDEISTHLRDSLHLVHRKLAIARNDPGYVQRLTQAGRDRNRLVEQLNSGQTPDHLALAESNDRVLMSLPHPARALQICRTDIQTSFLLGPRITADVWALARAKSSVNEVLYYIENSDDPDVAFFMDAQGRAEGVHNDGALGSAVFPLYYDAAAGKLFQFANTLVEALGVTDVGGDVPAQFLRAPAPVTYLQFGDQNVDISIGVSNSQTGLHALEGVYIVESQVESLMGRPSMFKELCLDPEQPCRILNLMFVGRPKGGVLDDATFHMSVYIQDDAMPVSELIGRHMRHYTNADTVRMAKSIPGYVSPPSDAQLAEYADLLSWLTTALLYLNTSGVRRELFAERSDMAKRLADLGPKKAAKLSRKMATTYDRIVISPNTSGARQSPGDQSSRTNRPHFRRGHIRMQAHGEGNKLRRPVFIAPLFVNKSSLGADQAHSKTYQVK